MGADQPDPGKLRNHRQHCRLSRPGHQDQSRLHLSSLSASPSIYRHPSLGLLSRAPSPHLPWRRRLPPPPPLLLLLRSCCRCSCRGLPTLLWSRSLLALPRRRSRLRCRSGGEAPPASLLPAACCTAQRSWTQEGACWAGGRGSARNTTCAGCTTRCCCCCCRCPCACWLGAAASQARWSQRDCRPPRPCSWPLTAAAAADGAAVAGPRAAARAGARFPQGSPAVLAVAKCCRRRWYTACWS